VTGSNRRRVKILQLPISPTCKNCWTTQSTSFSLLRTRDHFIAAFVAELDRVTRGKAFEILNDAVWKMLLDHRDAMVTHLASLAKSMYSPGGLFSVVMAHCLHALPRRRAWGLDRHDAHLQAAYDDAHKAAFERLFPASSTRTPKPVDLEALKDRFFALTRPVVADRDANRAHPFEEERGRITKMLGFGEIANVFDGMQEILNDFRLVSSGSTFGYHDMNSVGSKDAATDVVDLILNGTVARTKWQMQSLDRDAYYDRLHELHEGLDTDKLFNSAEIVMLLSPSALNASVGSICVAPFNFK
jgi:hypothetical protein